MNEIVKLSKVAKYSNKRIIAKNVSLQTFITTDNILQNKEGIKVATNLPPNENAMPFYETNNILVGNIRPYLKKIWFANQEGGCSADVLVFEVKKGYDPKFIYYALFRDDFFNHMMQGSKGTKMPRGDKNQILDFLVPDFDFTTQQKIASVLSSLDSKIELNNRINAELEAMAKTLYDYWFVQFDFPDINGKPYKTSGGKMVWNKELKREIPEGWKLGCFGEYVKVKGGYAFKSSWWTEEGLPVIKIKDINEDYTLSIENCSYVNKDKYESAKNYEAFPGDVVIALTGATIGKYGVVTKSEKPVLVNQRVGLFKLGNEPLIKLPFLINSLNQEYFRKTVFVIANGAAQPNISTDQIDEIPLILPQNKILENFNNKCSSFYGTILNNQTENKELSSLRDWLLPMLMNGQVTVGGSVEKKIEYEIEEEMRMVAEQG